MPDYNFDAIFSHLVLPPQLPRSSDGEYAGLASALGRRLRDACATLQKLFPADQAWEKLGATLQATGVLNQGLLARGDLVKYFKRLSISDGLDWLVIHLDTQNAALLVYKDEPSSRFVFEAFQVSAPSAVILSATHALTWDFPDRAVSISATEMQDESFIRNLARFLEDASSESFEMFAARAKKAGKSVVETREPSQPVLITEMLLSLLEGVGKAENVPRTRKRIRDDVVLDTSEAPWRRSPYWLVLRVATQRMLNFVSADGDSAGRVRYKFFLCMVLAHLLADCVGELHPERTLMLLAKLCRRLVKLESERSSCEPHKRPIYDILFEATSGAFQTIINNARTRVQSTWDNYKKTTIRHIPRLPRRAPEADTRLKLANSRDYLRNLLHSTKEVPHRQETTRDLPYAIDGTISQVASFADRYSALADYLQNNQAKHQSSEASPQKKCIISAQLLLGYIEQAGQAFHGDSLLMSRYLLGLFEYWTTMDQSATKACPVLLQYHPMLTPVSLDDLCLYTKSEMERLATVQNYLNNRIQQAGNGAFHIFAKPAATSSFPYAVSMLGILREIKSHGEIIHESSERAKSKKSAELAALTKKYESLTQSIEDRVCTCSRLPDGRRDVRGCTRCFKWRSRKKLKITIHEDYLPLNNTQKAAVILELIMPEYLSAYRTATWKLFLLGTQSGKTKGAEPAFTLKKFEPLYPYWSARSQTYDTITLASTKKSFLQTHYQLMKLPKQLKEVILPFGPSLSYYDHNSQTWAEDLPKVPSYRPLMGENIPRGIPNSYEHTEEPGSQAPRSSQFNHPSSYEIAANSLVCPSDMSIHEFNAFQRLISSRGRRWMNILVELASTNINFSSEAAMKLLNFLSLQSGPATLESDVLREAHIMLGDEAFCQRLREQLHRRLEALASSWREVHCLTIILTLTLRAFYLAPSKCKGMLEDVLVRIREITSKWILHLRETVRSTQDGDTAQKGASYALWSALLCRQTFAVYADLPEAATPLSQLGIQQFLRSSIALQENLLTSIDALPPALRAMLARDLTMTHTIRHKIKEWFNSDRSILSHSINETWTDSGASECRSYSSWEFLDSPQSWWLVCHTAGSRHTLPQVVHYHLLQGHLMIDGKPFGKLPLQMREDQRIKDIFETQHLLTCPSNLPGMQYQLVNDINGHQLHFGMRHGQVIVRAFFKGDVYEHVPRQMFRSGEGTKKSVDLPTDLIDDCVHWLNINRGLLEVRRKPNIWKKKPSNWILNVWSGVATRGQGTLNTNGNPKPGSRLVEPGSVVGKQISAIFSGFEDFERLAIYQPMGEKGRLSVEMKRLEIDFFVSNDGMLACRQLGAQIDKDQDIGTLYGLQSHIVMRDLHNDSRRSILVPAGDFSSERKGMHVITRISNEGMYARFSVDNILGRLTCPPDPKLLYLKAALHALTSFPIPDALTGRTGTEEALQCLSSARSQPWTALQDAPQRLLQVLGSLSPERKYYPPGLYTYQKVSWNKNLTMTIQHEGFGPLVRNILLQSQRLAIFETNGKVDDKLVSESLKSVGTDPLSLRGTVRRLIYQRDCLPSDSDMIASAQKNHKYSTMGAAYSSKRSCNVYRFMTKLLQTSNDSFDAASVGRALEACGCIGGFDGSLASLNILNLLKGDFPLSLGSYIQTFRATSTSDKYLSVFITALLAFRGDPGDTQIITFLVLLARCDAAASIAPPICPMYARFVYNELPNKEVLVDLIMPEQPPHHAFFYISPKRKSRKKLMCSIDDYQRFQTEEAERVTELLLSTWPSVPECFDDFKILVVNLGLLYMDLDKAWSVLYPEFERLRYNYGLSKYLQQLQSFRLGQSITRNGEPKLEAPKVFKASDFCLHDCSRARYENPRLIKELASRPYLGNRSLVPSNNSGPRFQHPVGQKVPDFSREGPNHRFQEIQVLKGIVQKFIQSPSTVRQEYGKDLDRSINALAADKATPKPQPLPFAWYEINSNLRSVRSELHIHDYTILRSLSQDTKGLQWLRSGNLWPCCSPLALLELLRSENESLLGIGMKKALADYALLITKWQRLLRMKDATLSRDTRRLEEEQQYEGHMNWDPMQHPDWILLEIDNDILIRKTQIDVAREIISPTSASNSVLQMNMGQGKTSCILPMAVAILANKKKLCRLVVPKALLLQTAQIIQSRLGGLVGRVIRHIPFSRRSPSSIPVLDLFEGIYRETMVIGGVMICLPEHQLSFEVSGYQKLADGHAKIAKKMIQMQKWLDSSCRDVLDESDFILSPKTQLIYPSGSALPVDGHPHRWRVIEELLGLVETHISTLQDIFQGGIEIIWRHRGFPIIHLVKAGLEDALNALLVDDICEGRLSKFQIEDDAPSTIKDNVRAIVTGADIPLSTWEDVKLHLVDDTFGSKTLYLLRGLISQRILTLCLSKLWNVQYGLHPDRAPMAVPFEAKGVPSATSEYGHPDTAIILTCLAFYQTGLTQSQVTESVRHVTISDDPASRWESLTYGCDLPPSLRHWNLINMDDEAQMEELWGYLRFDRNMINHYMNNFVFPRHAKQFDVKLQASGWDIPLVNTQNGGTFTTGFSGTNDNKRLLPETIKQGDLPSLLKTNAEVLSYLLENRNSYCYKASDEFGGHLTEHGLLELLSNQGIRVLIDAGAYILEMENHEVAAAWLAIEKDAKGAVYFDASSRVMVRARFQKTAIPLVSSPFADNLNDCVVYIDQRHTRGTDLKLPLWASGAVTLGLGQTKDQTVQAAMRLRQLGSTQCIAFVAPPEVYQSILDLTSTHGYKPVCSADVVQWLLEQSCLANEGMLALRLAQGTDYCRRMDALHQYSDFLQKKSSANKLLGIIQQREEQSLEELYGPVESGSASVAIETSVPRLRGYVSKLEAQKREMAQNGDKAIRSTALEEVEQEREVEFEVEQERESERPRHFQALGFHLDEDVFDFASSGVVKENSLAFIPAFEFLGTMKIGHRHRVKATGSTLFVSQQFTRTINHDNAKTSRSMVRPVEWILWCPDTEIAVVIIPEEAELLIPTLRGLTSPRVWMLSYSAPVTKSMQVFNSLEYFTVPSQKINRPFPDWLGVELAVLSGGLYFEYRQYRVLLAWLGVAEPTVSMGECMAKAKSESGYKLRAARSLKFLLEWLTYRRKTEDILNTPMGFVGQRRALKPDHAFFTVGMGTANRDKMVYLPQDRPKTADDEDSDDDGDGEMGGDWGPEADIGDDIGEAENLFDDTEVQLSKGLEDGIGDLHGEDEAGWWP